MINIAIVIHYATQEQSVIKQDLYILEERAQFLRILNLITLNL